MIRVARHHRSGYVLPMTLVLVALAGVVLEMASRRSLGAATDAIDAETALQIKWTRRSCAKTVPPLAERILSDVEAEYTRPVASHRLTITLNDLPVELVISDEQAKANVNALYERLGKERTTHQLQRLTASTPAPGIPSGGNRRSATANHYSRNHSGVSQLLLRPTHLDGRRQQGGPLPLFGSHDQVFQGATPRNLAIGSTSEPPLGHAITCWGDGKLNYRRAPVETIIAVCQPELSFAKAQELGELRAEQPGLGLSELLRRLELKQGQLRAIRNRLTGRSGCWSLWIAIHDDRREWFRLNILEQQQNNNGSTTEHQVRFDW